MFTSLDLCNLLKNKIFHFVLLFVWFQISHQTANDVNLQLTYLWKLPDFIFPDQQSREQAIQNGNFIPKNTIIIDTDIYKSNSNQIRYFVTTPSLKKGVPITLSEISNEMDGDTVLLRPFPSYEMNDRSSCDSLISVFRIQIDKCGNLWVMDSGLLEASTNDLITCPPKILIYDLKNNDVELTRYELNEESYRCTAHILNLEIESYEEDCSDSILYVADTSGGLIVYDWKQNTSWRASQHRFSLYPDDAMITINGVTVSSDMGIFGMALSPSTDNTRLLYWHSFGSIKESWVPTSIMKNREDALSSKVLDVQIITSEAAREGQSTVEIMTEDGILIYVLINKNALACWNVATPFTRDNQHIIYQDDENFQFITGLKLRNKELIITSCKLQRSMIETLDPNEVNYRIMSIGDVDQLLQRTPCKT